MLNCRLFILELKRFSNYAKVISEILELIQPIYECMIAISWAEFNQLRGVGHHSNVRFCSTAEMLQPNQIAEFKC